MTVTRPERVRGPLDDAFWDFCARGELHIQKCGECAGFTWPVEQACEHCGSRALQWERMSGEGRLVSWCAVHQDYYRGLLPLPYDCILVELEEGVLFVSNPHGFGYDDMSLGMALRLAFIDCRDPAGDKFRLPVFEKV